MKPRAQPFSKRDTRLLLVIISMIAIGTAATVAVSMHMLESLEDNSKKLTQLKVKGSDVRESALMDVADFEKNLWNFKEKHPIYQPLADEANKRKKAKDYKGSIKYFEKAVDAYIKELHGAPLQDFDKSKLGSIYSEIAQNYLELKDGKAAVANATKAIKYDEYREHYMLRSEAYALAKQKDKASRDLKKAMEMHKIFEENKKTIEEVLTIKH